MGFSDSYIMAENDLNPSLNPLKLLIRLLLALIFELEADVTKFYSKICQPQKACIHSAGECPN